MSVCRSILETDGCLILNVAAIFACALPTASRSSLRPSTSSLSSRNRASIRSRRRLGSEPIISPSVLPIDRLFAELAAGAGAGRYVVGLLRHRAGALGAQALGYGLVRAFSQDLATAATR